MNLFIKNSLAQLCTITTSAEVAKAWLRPSPQRERVGRKTG
jgi:hypothetical protein